MRHSTMVASLPFHAGHILPGRVGKAAVFNAFPDRTSLQSAVFSDLEKNRDISPSQAEKRPLYARHQASDSAVVAELVDAQR